MRTPEYKAVRGMGDIFPDEVHRWLELEERARRVCGRYGYGEIRIPLLEATELFVRSIGEATDIVEKQMFTFTDAGGRSITLRPEGTAGVVRAYLEKAAWRSQTLGKYFYLGPMFRRERPQAGRRRQFHQFGTEALGSDNPAVDAETIDLLLHYLALTGGEELRLGLNSVGCFKCRPAYQKRLGVYLDRKRDSLCDNCNRRLGKNILRVLDCKNPACRRVLISAPPLSDSLCPDCRSHFEAVTSLISALSLRFELDPWLVRGLDYYTRTVFEVYGPGLGAQDAVAAGGRYDNLIRELGGPPLGAVGFSVGLERLLLTSGSRSLPPVGPEKGSVYFISIGEKSFRLNFVLLSELRKKGVKGEIDYQNRSLKAQMREANRLDVDYAIIRGEEEMKRGGVKVKEMKGGEEETIGEKKVLEYIQGMTKSG